MNRNFDDRLREANAQYGQGDHQGALGLYRDLQIEDPQSPTLAYNMGLVHSEDATDLEQLSAYEDAVQALADAKASFQSALASPNDDVRLSADFALANAATQLAKVSVATQDQEGATNAFTEAIEGYESILDRNPDHEGAQANLDHARYRLKKLLQNPPPEQEQQQQQDGEEQQDGEQQESQDGEQQESQDGEQQEGEPQDGEHQDEQQQGEQQESDDQEEGEEEEYELDELDEANEQEEPDEGEASQMAQSQDETDAPTPQSQNLEALLQSIEEQDHREQHDMRSQPRDQRSTLEWW